MDSECPCSVRSQTSETLTSHSACRAMYSAFFTFRDSVQYWRSLRRPCLTPSAHVETFIYMWKGFVLVFTKNKYSCSRRETNWYLGNRSRLEGSFTTPPLYPTTHWIDGGMRPRAGVDALGNRKTVCVWRNRITIAQHYTSLLSRLLVVFMKNVRGCLWCVEWILKAHVPCEPCLRPLSTDTASREFL